ncbi:Spartin [Trichostrongylus colubriformis]|uniref:Spartin n=1 Tax=Trichostrongylus colubriformis TaxID=6319 RepID=A0AAN8FB52_TRICO
MYMKPMRLVKNAIMNPTYYPTYASFGVAGFIMAIYFCEWKQIMLKYMLRLSDTAHADALFSEAYACLDQGLCYEEDNDRENAASMYERALNLIAEAEQAKNSKKSELYKHLMEAKPSAVHRLKVLEKEIAENKSHQAEGANSEKHEKVKSELRGCLEGVGDAEADVIFSIPDGVQLFSIDGDETTVPTYPTSLQILRFNTANADSKLPSAPADALIQVGPWVYPLVAGKTPILRNDFGAYVVSNPIPENPNLAVAILLPADAGPKIEEEFRKILEQFADVRDQELKKELSEEDNHQISKKIAKLLIAGGERVAWGVETAAVKVTSYLDDKGEKYRSGLKPAEKPMTINPALKGSLLYMHKGSKLVAKCTRYLLDKVGDAGIAIGRSLASGAERTMGKGTGGGLVTGTISVIGGGIVGVSTVWMALENNSRTLCRNIADQTVQGVKIKYGDEASEAANHALFAAGHSSLAAAQLWDLGPRSIAGRMARRAGVQMVRDLHEKRAGEPLPLKTKIKDA